MCIGACEEKALKVDKLERGFWQKKIVNDEIWFQKKKLTICKADLT